MALTLSDVISVCAIVITCIVAYLVYRWTRQDRKEEKKVDKRENLIKEIAELKAKLVLLDETFKNLVQEQKNEHREISARIQKIDEILRGMHAKLQQVEATANYAREFSHKHDVFGERV